MSTEHKGLKPEKLQIYLVELEKTGALIRNTMEIRRASKKLMYTGKSGSF